MCQQATLCYGSGVAEGHGGEKREKEKRRESELVTRPGRWGMDII
jgi:hypothetical protein